MDISATSGVTFDQAGHRFDNGVESCRLDKRGRPRHSAGRHSPLKCPVEHERHADRLALLPPRRTGRSASWCSASPTAPAPLGKFTMIEEVAEVALFFAVFKSNALTGQISIMVSHG
jgi:hypothetical protein